MVAGVTGAGSINRKEGGGTRFGPWFPTIRFSSPGEGSHLGKRPTLPSAVGAPFRTTAQPSWLSSPPGLSVRPLGYWMAQLSTPDLPLSSRGANGGWAREQGFLELRFQGLLFVFDFNSVNIY